MSAAQRNTLSLEEQLNKLQDFTNKGNLHFLGETTWITSLNSEQNSKKTVMLLKKMQNSVEDIRVSKGKYAAYSV
jgi:hypothetical protein